MVNGREILRAVVFATQLLAVGIVGARAATVPETEPNDTLLTADAVGCSDAATGSISPASDVDYFTFVPAAQSEAIFITSGSIGADTMIRVYDASGAEIARNDDTPGGPAHSFSTCVVPCLPAGSAAYVRVESAGQVSPIASYRLVIACISSADVVEIEPNGSAASATTMGAAPVRGCGVSTAGTSDLDLMQFTLAADSFVTITNGPDGHDLSVSLFDSTGTSLWFDNNNRAPGGSQIALGLRAGTWIAGARNKFSTNAAQTWSMDVAVSAAANVEMESDETSASANTIACNQTIAGVIMESLNAAGDIDYYTFVLPGPDPTPVALVTGPAANDTVLTLLASNGASVIATNDDIGGGNLGAEIDATLAPGTYFVRVEGKILGRTLPAVPYSLSVLCPMGVVETESNDVAANADVGLDCGASVAGRIATVADVDYWSLTLATEQEIVATAAAGLDNAIVSLIGTDGITSLASGTNSASATLDAGTYFVTVSSAGTASLAYSLGVMCTPTPQPVDVEPNGDVTTTDAIGCGEDRIGLLRPAGDVDFWRFTLPSWSKVMATVDIPDPRSTVDPVLFFADAAGNPLRTNGRVGVRSARLVMSLPPGTWYACVTQANAGGGGLKDLYELHLVSCEPVDCRTSPIPIDNGFRVRTGLVVSREIGCLSFTTTDPNTAVDVLVTSEAGSIQPNVFLTDATDAYVDYDDDDGPGLAAEICRVLATPGEYRVRVQNFGASVGTYEVFMKYLSPPTPGESEPNNAAATADSILTLQPISGQLSSPTDVDYYTFTVPGPNAHGVSIVARSCADHDSYPQSATDLVLRLFDGTGGLILTRDDDDGTNADESIQLEEPPGVYFVAVSGTPGDSGAYELLLRVSDVVLTVAPTDVHLVRAGCLSSIPFRVNATNLRSATVRVDFEVQMQIGTATPRTLVRQSANLRGDSTVGKTFTRAPSFWLSLGSSSCPTMPTHARFIVVAKQGGVEITRDSYDFTILP